MALLAYGRVYGVTATVTSNAVRLLLLLRFTACDTITI